MMNIKHIAWDGGILTENWAGFMEQKTCKTLCGKRVKMVNISFDQCECQECIDIHNKEIENMNKMIDEYPQHFAGLKKQEKKQVYIPQPEKQYEMSAEDRLMAAIFGEEIY